MTSGLDITSDLLQDNIPVIRLLPAPIPPEGQAKWSSSGRTFLAALSPSSNSFAAWVAPKVDVTAKAWEDENGILQEEPVTRITDVYEPDKAIYMGAWGSADESLHAVSIISTARHRWPELTVSCSDIVASRVAVFYSYASSTKTHSPFSTRPKPSIRFTLLRSCPETYLRPMDHHRRPLTSRSRRSNAWAICESWRRTIWRRWKRL